MEHEFYSGISILLMVVYATKKFGPSVAAYLDKELDVSLRIRLKLYNELKQVSLHNFRPTQPSGTKDASTSRRSWRTQLPPKRRSNGVPKAKPFSWKPRRKMLHCNSKPNTVNVQCASTMKLKNAWTTKSSVRTSIVASHRNVKFNGSSTTC